MLVLHLFTRLFVLGPGLEADREPFLQLDADLSLLPTGPCAKCPAV